MTQRCRTLIDPSTIRSADNVIGLDDFYAVPALDLYMFMPTREMWPGQSVNDVLPAIQTSQKRNGKYVTLKPASWLRQFRRVEQVTWMPGSPAPGAANSGSATIRDNPWQRLTRRRRGTSVMSVVLNSFPFFSLARVFAVETGG